MALGVGQRSGSPESYDDCLELPDEWDIAPEANVNEQNAQIENLASGLKNIIVAFISNGEKEKAQSVFNQNRAILEQVFPGGFKEFIDLNS